MKALFTILCITFVHNISSIIVLVKLKIVLGFAE